MREIVIVISDLYLAPGRSGGPSDLAAAPGTLPGLEHAARFGRRRSIAGEGGWRPWLARWLGREDLAGVAPAVIADTGAGIAAVDSTAWMATPVHLITGLASLHVDRRSILRLSPTDLESFAQDFNLTFGDTDLHLAPLANGEFLMRGPATFIAATTEPARALVADLQTALPKGSDAKALKRLGAELEMWLHAHPLNETRRDRGELTVSTLWLWGGGSLAGREATREVSPTVQPISPARRQLTTALANSDPESTASGGDVALGADPYLTGLWHMRGGSTRELPDDKLASLLVDPQTQRAVLVTEVTPMLHSNPRWTVFEALAELDRLYVSPAIAALGAGVIEKVVLIANDTELQVGRHDRLKFWRRPRPAMEGL